MPKKDGSGMIEGNFVAEVYARSGFEDEVGEKIEHKSMPQSSHVDSAFSRDRERRAHQDELDGDVPF